MMDELIWRMGGMLIDRINKGLQEKTLSCCQLFQAYNALGLNPGLRG
jgi:hypothetical protein